ncbi:MAG: hypothetical protein F6K00_19800 [Leptolyngbya sp. SIOISBB]|nr:hypothetical protein [Leptolyngbya sp. SIOISBB]
MPEQSTKERLMGYPKEILVDYMLDGPLLFQIDFKKLEWRKLQLRRRKLLDEFRALLDVPTKPRSKWFQAHERIDQIQAQLERLEAKTDSLLWPEKEEVTHADGP